MASGTEVAREAQRTGSVARNDKSNSSYRWYGAILGIIGFVVLVVGGLIIIGQLTATALESDTLVLFGLALLIIGCGIFGLGWTSQEERRSMAEELTPGAKWSVLATLVTTVLIALMALWAHQANDVLWAVVSVGALGGLVHEIAQSKGTAFLPAKGTQSKKPAGPAVTAAGGGATAGVGGGGGTGASGGGKGEEGEDYLGGLVGIVLGGAAGLLTLGATSGTAIATSVSPQVIVAAFSAGIALKGISDSGASPTVKSKS